MVKKHTHRWSVIRDTQIRTTERHHCIPMGTMTTAIKQKPGRPTCGVGVRKGSPLSLRWGHKTVQMLWRRVWQFLRKLNTES